MTKSMHERIAAMLIARAGAIGLAAALVASADMPVASYAQTVMPSQVTPPTLRPPTSNDGVLGATGSESMDFQTGAPRKTQRKRPSKSGPGGGVETTPAPRHSKPPQ
jgi:hypothetical protein